MITNRVAQASQKPTPRSALHVSQHVLQIADMQQKREMHEKTNKIRAGITCHFNVRSIA